MVELDHYHSVEDIFAYIDEFKIKPTQKSLRRLAIGLAGHSQHYNKLELVLPFLSTSSMTPNSNTNTKSTTNNTTTPNTANANDNDNKEDESVGGVGSSSGSNSDPFEHLPAFFARRLRYQIQQREIEINEEVGSEGGAGGDTGVNTGATSYN